MDLSTYQYIRSSSRRSRRSRSSRRNSGASRVGVGVGVGTIGGVLGVGQLEETE